MTKFENRIRRLEQQIPDRRAKIPEEPRVAGRPREVAIAERIEWLRVMSINLTVNEQQRQQFLERADGLTKIWSNLTSHSTSTTPQQEVDEV